LNGDAHAACSEHNHNVVVVYWHFDMKDRSIKRVADGYMVGMQLNAQTAMLFQKYSVIFRSLEWILMEDVRQPFIQLDDTLITEFPDVSPNARFAAWTIRPPPRCVCIQDGTPPKRFVSSIAMASSIHLSQPSSDQQGCNVPYSNQMPENHTKCASSVNGIYSL